MRSNPGRMAWAVLLTAFLVLCVLLVSVPWGVRAYLHGAQSEHDALVEALTGTIVVEPPVGRGPMPLSKGQSAWVPQGTVVRVDENSEATITFFDHSFMQVFPSTTLRLERMRSPRYRVSEQPGSIHLALQVGRVRIGTAVPVTSDLDLRVSTLQGEVLLAADGSYALEASNVRTDVAVYRGRADARTESGAVSVGARQRTVLALGEPPREPTGVERNLIANGDFVEPLEGTWRVFNDQGTDGGDVDGYVELVMDEGRRAVRFVRFGGHGNHCETILEQTINQTLPDATSLVVRAMVKLRYQSLSGGGYLSSEYPLMIRVTYRDAYDSEAEWIQGFYYQNVDDNPTMYGLEIPQDRWYLYESPNLMEELPVQPHRIMRIRVYASGWDYESLVSYVNLIAE